MLRVCVSVVVGFSDGVSMFAGVDLGLLLMMSGSVLNLTCFPIAPLMCRLFRLRFDPCCFVTWCNRGSYMILLTVAGCLFYSFPFIFGRTYSVPLGGLVVAEFWHQSLISDLTDGIVVFQQSCPCQGCCRFESVKLNLSSCWGVVLLVKESGGQP